MVEISEKERARRRAERAASTSKMTPAQSFRLGEEHLDRLKRLSQRQDLAQVEMLRILIDREWTRVQDARRAKSA